MRTYIAAVSIHAMKMIQFEKFAMFEYFPGRLKPTYNMADARRRRRLYAELWLYSIDFKSLAD